MENPENNQNNLELNLGVYPIDGATTNHDFCREVFSKEKFPFRKMKMFYPDLQDNFMNTDETVLAMKAACGVRFYLSMC